MSNPKTEPQQFIGSLIGGALIKKGVEIALEKAMDRVVKSPSLPVEQRDSAPIKEIVRNEVLKEVGPLVENMTNQEPWYRSKVVWSSLGTVAISASAIATMWMDGVPNLPNEYMFHGAAIITALGAIGARLFTSKALGR